MVYRSTVDAIAVAASAALGHSSYETRECYTPL
jgi:hypothetical protein